MVFLHSFSIVGLRVSLGLYFLYAGISKITNSEWSAKGYLDNAQTFSPFYSFLASPDLLPLTNFLNEWGLTFIGVSLLLGLLTRVGAVAGTVLMLLYYFPALSFPYAGEHAYIIDDHIIYAFALLVLMVLHAGRIWGLDAVVAKRKGFIVRCI